MNNVYALPITQRAGAVARPRKAALYFMPECIVLAYHQRMRFREENALRRQRQTAHIIKAIHSLALHLKVADEVEKSARFIALREFSRNKRSPAYSIQRGYDEIYESRIPLLTDRIWGEMA